MLSQHVEELIACAIFPDHIEVITTVRWVSSTTLRSSPFSSSLQKSAMVPLDTEVLPRVIPPDALCCSMEFFMFSGVGCCPLRKAKTALEEPILPPRNSPQAGSYEAVPWDEPIIEDIFEISPGIEMIS